MSENEVKGSLSDVDSLDDGEKEQLADGCYLAANDVANKKGRARKIRVKIINKDDLEIELVGINYNIEPKPYPKAEDKLDVIGLSEKVSNELKDKIKDGCINSTHITDIQKLTVIDKLIQLDAESQEKVIKFIIENRNGKNQINSEEITSHILRSGYEDNFIIETWYSGMLRLVKKLHQHADVSEKVVSQLSNQNQTNLKKEVSNLIKILDRFG